jgi:hypothetical protein
MLNQLAAIQATGLAVNFERGLCRETRLTQYRAGTHTPGAPVARQTLAFTTPQTILYNVRTANLAKTYDSLTSALAQTGLAGASESIGRFEQSLRQTGVRIVEDVLAKLGPEVAFVVNWREGAELPDVALVTEIQDAPATRPQLDKMFDSLKQQFFDTMPEVGVWDESEAGPRRLRTLRIGAGKIAPTYVTTDKFFILALTPDFARQLLHDSPATLATSESYQAAVKPLPAAGTSFTYLDLRALYPHLHALPQNPLSLPPPAAVTSHLAPYVSISVDTAEAETTYSDASLGTPVVFMAAVVAGYFGNQSALTLPLESPRPSSSTASPQ